MLELARPVAAVATAGPIAYSIATLVSDHGQYAEMLRTFLEKGFGPADCEFLYIDNTGGNGLDAYAGLNRLLDEARGRFVILCHQDVRLIDDGRADLDRRLADLEERDPAWAVAGNAGATGLGRFALRITDGHMVDATIGQLPARVVSLDENFLVLKRSARLGFSADLAGFHYYGTDLCLLADVHGHSAYVIDFHLHHLSRGTLSPAFYACEAALQRKYARAFRPRWVQTTCSRAYVSGTPVGHRLEGLLRLVAEKLPQKLAALARALPAGRTSPAGARQE